jgi:hypothetical protein
VLKLANRILLKRIDRKVLWVQIPSGAFNKIYLIREDKMEVSKEYYYRDERHDDLFALAELFNFSVADSGIHGSVAVIWVREQGWESMPKEDIKWKRIYDFRDHFHCENWTPPFVDQVTKGWNGTCGYSFKI